VTSAHIQRVFFITGVITAEQVVSLHAMQQECHPLCGKNSEDKK